MQDSELVRVGTVDYSEAKRLKAALEERGVMLKLISDPESCGTGGCSPKLELFARNEDLPKVAAFLEEERGRDLGDLVHDVSLSQEVFDPEKETARCPACGTEFSTRLSECPDCGLGFGGGD